MKKIYTALIVIVLMGLADRLDAALLVNDSYHVQATADESNGIYGDEAALADFNPQGGTVQGFGAYASNSGANIFAATGGLSYSSATVQTIGGGANGGAITKKASTVTPIRYFDAGIGDADTMYIRFLTQNTSTEGLWVDFSLGQTKFSFYTKDKTTLDILGSDGTDILNAFVADETNLILIGVNVATGNDSISLYVNPALNQDGSLASSPLKTLTNFNIVDPNDSFSTLLVNMGNSSYKVNWFDEIAIGTELGDVVSPVPEPSTLGLLLLIAGSALIRRLRMG
jgi:hypothetical protein